MIKKTIPQKLIIVESSGVISELGGISGPILNPCYVPVHTILTMLNHHRKVLEVNPKNYNDRIRLSLKNLNKNNFSDSEEFAKEKTNSAPTIFSEAKITNSKDGESTNTASMVVEKKTSQNSKNENITKVQEEKKSDIITSDFTKND